MFIYADTFGELCLLMTKTAMDESTFQYTVGINSAPENL